MIRLIGLEKGFSDILQLFIGILFGFNFNLFSLELVGS
jgi:hypothetical protein